MPWTATLWQSFSLPAINKFSIKAIRRDKVKMYFFVLKVVGIIKANKHDFLNTGIF